MYKKKYNICISIILILILVSCRNIGNKEVSNTMQNKLSLKFDELSHADDSEYTISNKDYEIGKNKVLIPQITDMDNVNEQKMINSIITESVSEKIKKYFNEDIKGTFHNFKYITKFKSEKLLSFLFEGDYYIKGAAHPCIFGFSINIDLDKSIILEQSDIIAINEYIVELFMNKKFVGKNEISKSFYLKYLDYVTQEQAMLVLKKSEVCYSDKGIDFIIDTNYATGGYMLLELTYDLFP